jgi:hypothetical protein
VRGGDRTIWLAEDGLWVTVLEKPSSPQPPSPNLGEGEAILPSPKFGRGAGGEGQIHKGVNLRFTFPGANPHPRLEPFNCLDTHVSYFFGNDPEQWHADVPVWDEATGQGNNLKYRVVGFGRVQITDYRLPGQNRISAIFWGATTCPDQ